MDMWQLMIRIDNDSTSTNIFVDADCDGVITADDCDDNDVTMPNQMPIAMVFVPMMTVMTTTAILQ